MIQVLGEACSIAADLAVASICCALKAVVQARTARAGSARRRAWERAAASFRAGSRSLAEAEQVALKRAAEG